MKPLFKTIGFWLVMFLIFVIVKFAGEVYGRTSAERQLSTKETTNEVNIVDEMKKFEIESTNHTNRMMEILISDLNENGWFTLFDPNRIKSDVNLKESKRIIKSVRSLSKKRRQMMAEYRDSTKSRIMSLRIPSDAKEKMLSVFYKASERVDEVATLDEQCISEAEKIISILSSSKEWAVLDGKIMLYNEYERERASAHWDAMENISTQQMRMYKEMNGKNL